MTHWEKLNDFLVSCFYSILWAEEKALGPVSNNTLSIKEIHVIDAVCKAKTKNKNTFSHIANILNITLGTLTTSFARLQRKGYLAKRQDATDKRVYFIEPTELGIFINKKHDEFHKKMVEGIIELLPEKELDNLVSSLGVLETFFRQQMK